MADNREQALEQALKSIEKDFGKGSIMRLGDKVKEKYDVIHVHAEGPCFFLWMLGKKHRGLMIVVILTILRL